MKSASSEESKRNFLYSLLGYSAPRHKEHKKLEEKKESHAKKRTTHPLAAGRVGDKYRGGTISKIDRRNAKAEVEE